MDPNLGGVHGFAGFILFLFGLFLFFIGELCGGDTQHKFEYNEKIDGPRMRFFYFLSKLGIFLMLCPLLRLAIWFLFYNK
jgi:hypothetical protein